MKAEIESAKLLNQIDPPKNFISYYIKYHPALDAIHTKTILTILEVKNSSKSESSLICSYKMLVSSLP